MKILPIISLLLISTPVFAVANKSQGNDAKAQETSTKVMQNLQNQGEDLQIKIREREEVKTKEYLETMTPEQAKEKAEKTKENMSEVAKRVHELLQDPDRFGGIGAQVSEIAKNQNEAQNRLENHYEKLQNRSRFVKMLFGADKSSVEGISTIITENEDRLEELIDLRDSAETQEESEKLNEMIDSIMEQNAGLLQKVEEERNTGIFRSIFSRLRNLLGAK